MLKNVAIRNDHISVIERSTVNKLYLRNKNLFWKMDSRGDTKLMFHCVAVLSTNSDWNLSLCNVGEILK